MKAASLAFVFLFAIVCTSAYAQEQTVGLFVYDSASYNGYTLFAPTGSTTTYLMDNYGRVVHTWESDYAPGESVYLLENGNIVRAVKIPGGAGVEETAWDGAVVWFFDYAGSDHRQHHDIEPLPNGNVLILAREFKTYDEAIAAGRDPSLLVADELWPEYIVEVEPTGPTGGNIVWEWHLWDHLIQDYDSTKNNYGNVMGHPELLDINFIKHRQSDWIHANAVEYNPDLDQIILSSRALSEIWIIDHSTTTEEAAGHSGGNHGKGGDFLYRWGNPQSYRAGTIGDQKYYAQHSPQWIKPDLPGEGNILVFNNGDGRPEGQYSTIDEFIPPVDENGMYSQTAPGVPYGPASQLWTYIADPPESFYSGSISGAQRMPNGNTLVCSGRTGRFFEVTPAGDIVWEYINPVTDAGIMEQGEQVPAASNSVFRITRFAADYAGFEGHDLTPEGQIEIYPVRISGAAHTPVEPLTNDSIFVTATITDTTGFVNAVLHVDTGDGYHSLTMYDDGHHHDGQSDDNLFGAVVAPLLEPLSAAFYISADDGSGESTNDPPDAPNITYYLNVGGPDILCGDANGDEAINIGDAVYVIDYVFKSGPPPDPVCRGDASGDYAVNIGDAVYLISYIFKGGPGPIDPCCP